MPKSLSSLFTSKDQGESLNARTEALSRLFAETLRTLQAKNLLTGDEVEDVFDRAAEGTFDDVEDYINLVYQLLYPPDDDGDGEKSEPEEENG